MKVLIFGLPGTGKTKLARRYSGLSLDLGKIDNPSISEQINRKLQKFTEQFLKQERFIVESYPDYFELSTIPSDVTVHVAIPTVEDIPIILKRLERRSSSKEQRQWFKNDVKPNYKR